MRSDTDPKLPPDPKLPLFIADVDARGLSNSTDANKARELLRKLPIAEIDNRIRKIQSVAKSGNERDAAAWASDVERLIAHYRSVEMINETERTRALDQLAAVK